MIAYTLFEYYRKYAACFNLYVRVRGGLIGYELENTRKRTGTPLSTNLVALRAMLNCEEAVGFE